MEEKRSSKRWQQESENFGSIVCAGLREEVKVLDISIGGMKISFPKQVDIGTDLYGMVKIRPDKPPFYVSGKVVRVTQSEGFWETAIEFERVRTFDFHDLMQDTVKAGV